MFSRCCSSRLGPSDSSRQHVCGMLALLVIWSVLFDIVSGCALNSSDRSMCTRCSCRFLRRRPVTKLVTQLTLHCLRHMHHRVPCPAACAQHSTVFPPSSLMAHPEAASSKTSAATDCNACMPQALWRDYYSTLMQFKQYPA